ATEVTGLLFCPSVPMRAETVTVTLERSALARAFRCLHPDTHVGQTRRCRIERAAPFEDHAECRRHRVRLGLSPRLPIPPTPRAQEPSGMRTQHVVQRPFHSRIHTVPARVDRIK